MRKDKVKKLAVLSAAITVLLSKLVFAGEVLELNLRDAMERAFNTNPAISIADYEMESARADYNAARQSRGITIVGEHESSRGGSNHSTYRVRDDGTIVRTKGIGSTHSNTLTASLPIFTGGELQGTIEQARANYKSALVGVQRSYNEMRATVTNAYYDMLQADNMQKLQAESVEQLADHLKNVNAQYDVGVVAKIDVLRSEVELADAQQSLISAENTYQVAEATLNRIMGLPMDTTLKLQDRLNYVPYDKDMQYCLDYAAEHRPDLEQARQVVKAYEGALKTARSGYMPKITANASQGWYDSNWPGDENGNWSVGVGVTWNIFDTGVTRAKSHGAEADLARAKENYRDTTDAVMLEVRNDYLSLREAEKRIYTTQVALAAAEEDFYIAKVRYMAGVGTNTDVLDAQVALTTVKTNYVKSLYDYNIAITALETAIGEPMEFPHPITVEPGTNVTVEPKGEDKEVAAEAKSESDKAKGEDIAEDTAAVDAKAEQAIDSAEKTISEMQSAIDETKTEEVWIESANKEETAENNVAVAPSNALEHAETDIENASTAITEEVDNANAEDYEVEAGAQTVGSL